MKAITQKEFTFYQSRYTSISIQLYPYFSTSVNSLGSWGQCQERILTGLLLSFYNTYNKHHIKDITQLDDSVIDNILNDIEILKKYYALGSFYYVKSYKGLINTNKTIEENIFLNELNKKLKLKLVEKGTKKINKI